ncbi:MAG: hypothetical protein JJE37_11525 [Methyloceanibacter sp.]|nr:hypothetical protein [Methyloceanibacter sp.]
MTDIAVPAKPKFEIPLDLQAAPKVIEKHKGSDDDDILNAMVRAADGIAEASTSAKTAAEAILANEMAEPIKNVANARRRVKEISEAATKRLTDTRDRVDGAIARLEAATLPQLPKDMLGAVAAIQGMEVRAALRSMKPDDRLKMVREAVESGDAGFVSAVVNGSHVLTGMGKAELAVARDMWQRKWHGETLARVQRLRAAQTQLDRLSGLFTRWSSGILADKDAAVAAAEKSDELAAAAMAKPGSPKSAGEPRWDADVAST